MLTSDLYDQYIYILLTVQVCTHMFLVFELYLLVPVQVSHELRDDRFAHVPQEVELQRAQAVHTHALRERRQSARACVLVASGEFVEAHAGVMLRGHVKPTRTYSI